MLVTERALFKSKKVAGRVIRTDLRPAGDDGLAICTLIGMRCESRIPKRSSHGSFGALETTKGAESRWHARLKLSNVRGTLYVTVTGDNTVETLSKLTRPEIPQACIKLQKTRVLIVVQLSGPEPSMLDVYKGVASGTDGAVGLGMRVAYIDENETHNTDTQLLAEDVARGRGIPVRSISRR